MLVEALLFGALIFLLWQSFRKPPGLPPGRWGLPLVGYIPLTRKSLEDQIQDLQKQHGDIFLWRMGTQVMVFLNDYKLVKEAFSRPEFTDRPDWETFKIFEDPAVGIGSSNGLLWHNNRRFTLRQLRDLGMGKSKLVETIQHQALEFRKSIAKQAGKAAPIPHDLHVAVVNVIWQMVASKQFDAEDPRLKKFVKLMRDFLVASNRFAFKDFLPWLEYLMPAFLFKILIKHAEIVAIKESFFTYFFEEIEHHRATLDPDNPRDLMDGYLLEMEERKDDPETTCSDQDLAFLVFDLFFAGSETTTNTFNWVSGYLAGYPNVQQKLHAEIDAVLPKGVLATLADKPKMPYLEAIVNEVMRLSSLVNFGVQHAASTNTELGGYTIPKGTILSSSVFAIQSDSRYWDQPEKFMPERWLDEAGKFVSKKEGFLPFGVGKRACPGESLARMELFIFLTTIYQNFSIAPPPGTTVDLTPDTSGFFFHLPKFNDLIFTARQ
ncbi:cytochrome P450 2L1-like isoform X1 [Eriocheir sinensis]|uniref:Cytochrome P450 CYP2 n=1 Tax=Eriocheir sinensis TaxID=95602 RepID=A0A0K2CTL6_ERISI|nr:cytochrome P450 2L1-like isoform X1 [Eriocheir sinensis]XP_050695432.1 cytochrome P450 2L1-like isoform X1 [Eriocheir sinensis]XP_050695433.1 cytochrome P450 2L1-like isoform X1 [Eriocheir sinensis]ALA09303.1 cytochrome P450 CYP2 [Eriocheir sinensis]